MLRRCLAKDPKRRLPDIADARPEIDEAQTTPSDPRDASPTVAHGIARRRRERVGGSSRPRALLDSSRRWPSAAPAPAIYRPRRFAATARRSCFRPVCACRPPSPAGRFVLSPDGRRLAMVASDSTGRSMLWVRSLDSRVAQALGGTEGATYPFWSADSRFIAFSPENNASPTSPAMTSGRTGPAPVATESSSARCEKEVSTCTRNRRAVLAAKHFCSRMTSGSSTRARPRMVNSLCTGRRRRHRSKRYLGAPHCLARESRPRSWKRGSLSPRLRSLPTDDGSLSCRTSPENPRST